MDAVKFIEERDRMFEVAKQAPSLCYGHKKSAEEIVCEVEEWSAAHPRKTRQSVFLGQWPNVVLDEHDVIAICPTTLSSAHRDRIKDCANPARRCADCRKEFWSQEVE